MTRGIAARRGYGQKWREAAKAFIARPENFWCVCGCGRPADMVDHKIAHKGVLTEGGFGNARSGRPCGSPGCHDDGTPRDPHHYWNKR